MKRILAALLCLALLLSGAALAEEKEVLGTISINGAFLLQCDLPTGYTVKPYSVTRDQIIATISAEDPARPRMVLSVAFDETYADVDRMNDLTEEELGILEATFTEMDPTVDISYSETAYGTRLLIARQTKDEAGMSYVDFLSVYKGYFVEFVMFPGEASDGVLTDEQIQMCIDYLSELDFVPVDLDAMALANLAGKRYAARILSYDEAHNELKVELREPRVWDEAAVSALAVGSEFALEGETIVIDSIKEDEGVIVLNDEVELRPDGEGGYNAFFYDAIEQVVLAELSLPVSENLVFEDNIDRDSLEFLDEPIVMNAEEFLALLDNDSVGFAADNVYVTFDADSSLKLIERVYVPWQ